MTKNLNNGSQKTMFDHGYSPSKRCFHSHPPLKVGDHVIYGGSCIEPVVKDADIYVGFDYGMQRLQQPYPWEEQKPMPVEVYFPIQDMGVPPNLDQFKGLIDWLAVQLIAGKKIHMGCIGGHGRTGLVLAALVKKVMGTEDAITYVRENYCQKAVESAKQVEYLHKHFGIKVVNGAKEAKWGTPNSKWSAGHGNIASPGVTSARTMDKGTPPRDNGAINAFPARHPMSVWGQNFARTTGK